MRAKPFVPSELPVFPFFLFHASDVFCLAESSPASPTPDRLGHSWRDTSTAC